MQPTVAASSDELYIAETLKLATKGRGWTNPNPMVGAVIVKKGKVIGQGHHRRAGTEHAEVVALKSCTSDPRGATLYVNLEPCSHLGKTPPCTDAIIKAGIQRVVCSTLDPNPAVHGQGRDQLKAANIEFSLGIFAQEAKELNECFFSFHQKGRPFIAIKFASSLDGKMATKTGDSSWITNDSAREYARRLRAEYQAILVGSKTALHDDPHLGVRHKSAKDPLRIILDSRLRLSRDAQVLRDSNVLLVTTTRAPSEKVHYYQQQGFEVVVFKGSFIPLNVLMKKLHTMNIISVFVEGGGTIIGSFIDDMLVDKVYAFYAPVIIGGAKASHIGGDGKTEMSNAIRLQDVTFKRFNDNFLITGYPHRDSAVLSSNGS